LEALAAHGRALFGERDPAARLGESARLRFERDAEGGRLRLPLPGVDPGALEVARVDDELVVGFEGARRKIALPTGLAKLDVSGVAYHGGELVVSFALAEAPAA
ncbi:MAG: hypothetical protein KDE23_27745, partial [Caldilinea sp.]|nr:hypothetical protein [Caldilinea sp.]